MPTGTDDTGVEMAQLVVEILATAAMAAIVRSRTPWEETEYLRTPERSWARQNSRSPGQARKTAAIRRSSIRPARETSSPRDARRRMQYRERRARLRGWR